MKSLHEFAPQKHRGDLVQREKPRLETLPLVQVRLDEFSHAARQETVRPVVRACGIGAERIQQSPFSFPITGIIKIGAVFGRNTGFKKSDKIAAGFFRRQFDRVYRKRQKNGQEEKEKGHSKTFTNMTAER